MYGLVHDESVGPEARRLWDMFLAGRYDSIDEYLLALNRYGRAAGYAFVKRRSTRYRDGQATRYVLACDKANKRPSQATIRNRTTDKTNCPFTVQAVYLGHKWRVEEIPGATHNHPPAEDPYKLRFHKRRTRLQKNGVIEASPEPEVQEIPPPPQPPVEGIRIVLEACIPTPTLPPIALSPDSSLCRQPTNSKAQLRPTPDRYLQVDAFMDEIPSKQAQIIGKSIRLPIPADEMGNIDISILRRSRLINTPMEHLQPAPIQQAQPLQQPSQQAPEAQPTPQQAPQPPQPAQPAQPPQPAQASEPIEIEESSDSDEEGEEGEEEEEDASPS